MTDSCFPIFPGLVKTANHHMDVADKLHVVPEGAFGAGCAFQQLNYTVPV